MQCTISLRCSVLLHYFENRLILNYKNKNGEFFKHSVKCKIILSYKNHVLYRSHLCNLASCMVSTVSCVCHFTNSSAFWIEFKYVDVCGLWNSAISTGMSAVCTGCCCSMSINWHALLARTRRRLANFCGTVSTSCNHGTSTYLVSSQLCPLSMVLFDFMVVERILQAGFNLMLCSGSCECYHTDYLYSVSEDFCQY